MTCHDAREAFSALVDGALGADERAALDGHLATCAECRRELQRFRDTVALLRGAAPVRAPAGFVDRVLEAARPAPWPRRLLRGLFLPWPVKLPIEAAAIVLVTVGVVYVYRATPELQQSVRLGPTSPAVTEKPRLTPEPSAPSSSPEKNQPQEQDKAGRSMEKKMAAPPPAARDEASRRAADLRDASPDAGRQKEAGRPAPAAPPVGGKVEAPPVRAGREPEVAQERARARAAPVPESRADAPRAQRPATGPSGVLSSVPPDVSGRLAVSDRAAALRGLAELVARLGAVESRRVDASDATLVELTIPREAYPELARQLGRLGRWQPSQEPAALPVQVRVVLRITG
ncbi:MAG TPA: zf-HC2 domain-containing protein [Candidatus Binatia bacterium]|nr:zf-HC2 domain-containing protein [Candidatus Binatia bacterium]